MKLLSSIFRPSVATLLLTFAIGRVEAQDASPVRFGLGVTGLAGWISANSSVFMGGEGFVRIAGGSYWSARVDGAYYGALTPPENIGCVTPFPAPACDTRHLGKLGTAMATLVVGSRESNSLRHVYGLFGAGIALTRWGGGVFLPASNSGASMQQGVGAGPTLAVFQAGLGSEFRALGGNRIELRIVGVKPSTPAFATGRASDNSGRSVSLTLGRVW